MGLHRRQQPPARFFATRSGQQGGDFVFAERQQAIAGQQQLITRLERIGLTRQVHQFDFVAGNGTDQRIAGGMAKRIGGADLTVAVVAVDDVAADEVVAEVVVEIVAEVEDSSSLLSTL